VLTGNENSQQDYVRDRGENPAIAVDAAGWVIEVHDSGGGDLWLWTGQVEATGEIRWHHHAQYEHGSRNAGLLIPGFSMTGHTAIRSAELGRVDITTCHRGGQLKISEGVLGPPRNCVCMARGG
jgi:hypothetical protein